MEKKTTDGAFAVHVAAQKGSYDALELLLKAKADPNVQTGDGATPLMLARHHGHQSSVRLLEDYKADTSMALHVTAQNDNLNQRRRQMSRFA